MTDKLLINLKTITHTYTGFPHGQKIRKSKKKLRKMTKVR